MPFLGGSATSPPFGPWFVLLGASFLRLNPVPTKGRSTESWLTGDFGVKFLGEFEPGLLEKRDMFKGSSTYPHTLGVNTQSHSP